MLTPKQELAFDEITPLSESDVQHLDFIKAEIERLNGARKLSAKTI